MGATSREHGQSHDAGRQSADLYHRALFEGVADAILVSDAEGGLLDANPAAVTLLGYTREELLRLRAPDIYAADPSVVEARYARFVEDGSFASEVVLRRKDGSTMPVEVTATRVALPSGIAYVATLRDITDRRQADRALRASEERFHRIVETSPDLICILDAHGRYRFVNSAYRTILGYEPEGLLGEQTLTLLHPEDAATVQERFAGLTLSTEENPVSLTHDLDFTVRTRHADGHWLVMEAKWQMLTDEQGRFAGVLVLSRDVTERQRAEEERAALMAREHAARIAAQEALTARDEALTAAEGDRSRLRNALMQAPAMVAVTHGPEHILTFANPRFHATMGAGDWIGHPLRTRLPQLMRAGLMALLDHVYATGEQFKADETRLQLRSQESATPEDRYFNFLLVRVRDRTGRIDGVLLHANEVTEQVHARRRAEVLAEENARLLLETQEALRVREEFLSVASHELRTPLTPLKGNIELLRRRLAATETGGEVNRLVERAERQVDRLTGLVAELLDVSRIAAGRFVLTTAPVAVSALVQRVVQLQSATANPPRRVDFAPSDPEFVISADEDRLEQVLINLLDNACKYSPPLTPIRVEIAATEEAVSVSVRDLGSGVPEEEHERIFERFQRASNADRNISGLGLGLHIAREIVHLHGGVITVESSPGSGSTFTVRLPYQRTEA